MIVEPGNKIPLSALLADFNEDLFVRAYLYTSGAPFSTAFVNLTPVAKGEYVDNSVYMPADVLQAVYVAYKDPGYTEIAGYYGGVDVFQPLGLKREILDLEASVESIQDIEAILESPELQAEVGDDTTDNALETPESSVAIDVADLSAEVSDDDVDGEAGC